MYMEDNMYLSSKEIKNCFVKAYREIFPPALALSGFARKRDIFHKFINNQVVVLLGYKYYHPNEFTIQWEIYPLCDGAEFEVFMDSNYGTDGLFGENGRWVFGAYDDNNSITQRAYKVLEFVQTNVLPIVSDITDYESCYRTMRKVDEKMGLLGNTVIPNGDLMHYGNLLLAIGEYENALKAKKAILYQNSVIANIQPTHHNYPRYLKRVEEYNFLARLIEDKCYNEIQSFIKEKEDFSLASYRKKFLGVKTTK